MIHFNWIESKNFCAIGEQPIRIMLDRSPTTLVTGGNGAGKSSNLIESLVYNLYGKPYRNVKVATLVNSTNNKGLLTRCSFTRGGVEYIVERGQKPGIFIVYKAGEAIPDPAGRGEYQKILEEILGMSHKVFIQIVVLNRNGYKPFMSLGAADRRVVVEELLDIGIFSRMNKNIKDRAAALKIELSELDYKMQMKERAVQSQEKIIETATGNADELIREKQDQRQMHTDQIHTMTARIEEIQSDLAENTAKIADLDLVNKKMGELANYGKDISRNVTGFDKDIEFYSSVSNCPTCKQDIDEDTKHSSLTALNDKRQQMVDGLGMLQKEVETLQVRLTEIAEVQSQIRVCNSDINSLNNDINNANYSINNIDQDIAKLQDQISGLDAERKLLSTYVEEYEEMGVTREALFKKRNEINTLLMMLKDDGIKARIVRKYIPVFNKSINKYLGAMNFYINFILDENFDEKVMIPGRENFEYNNFSDGQKTRIDLSILLTWIEVAKSKNSVDTNLLILDETLEAVDADGIKEFLNAYDTGFKDTNLFVITQRGDEFSDHFRSSINFQLKDNFTVMD